LAIATIRSTGVLLKAVEDEVQMRNCTALLLTAAGVFLAGFVAVAEPAAAATCLGLAPKPVSDGFEVIGKNTAACSGRAGNVSVYVALEWQLPREGGWVEIARNRTTTKVGEKRSITVTAACNGNTRSGYRTRGSIYLNGIQKSSSPTAREILPCGR
jgi:hypothetical protein